MTPRFLADHLSFYISSFVPEESRTADLLKQADALIAALHLVPESYELSATEPRTLPDLKRVLKALRPIADQMFVSDASSSLGRRLTAHAAGLCRRLPTHTPLRPPVPIAPVAPVPAPPPVSASLDVTDAQVQGPRPERLYPPPSFHELHRSRIDREERRSAASHRKRLENIQNIDTDREINDALRTAATV